MKTELHILGTSSSRPANGREVSGSVVICGGKTILVDCGEGFQSRLLNHARILKKNNWQSRLAHTRIDVMLFTHGHLDHTWGAMPMLQSMALDGRQRELTIAAPIHHDAYSALVEGGYSAEIPDSVAEVDMIYQLRLWWKLCRDKVEESSIFKIKWYAFCWIEGAESWLELEPMTGAVKQLSDPPIILENVSMMPLQTIHSVPSCAWRIDANEKRGKFNREKADNLGLVVDEIAKLASGTDIEKDGATIHARDFRGEARQGSSLLISGDTGIEAPGFAILENQKALDLMVHEATYIDEQEKYARQYKHATASDAARAALQSNARHLVITHYSSRLTEVETSLAEARKIHDAVCSAEDGDIYVIDEDGDIGLFRMQESQLNPITSPFG